MIPSEESPKWSSVYHPEVEQTLELHSAHTFAYDANVHYIYMSPDGQRLAVGLGGGKALLYELNIRLASGPFI